MKRRAHLRTWSSTNEPRTTFTRRQLLRAGVAATAGLYFLTKNPSKRVLAQIPGGTLPPADIPKFVTELVKPPAMPQRAVGGGPPGVDKYRIAMRQFQQFILPAELELPTTVWSYGSTDHPGTVLEGGTFNYPAFTMEALWNRPVQVEWVNDLVDENGNYLPHLFWVDQTLHWANPPGGRKDRDTRSLDPLPYLGPVPMVTHVHGAHTTEESDGYPEAWYLPNANNIPGKFAKTGTWYDAFVKKYKLKWDPGTAVFRYPNDQRATTLWYHDHTLGMTRLNVYAGPAGFYLIRGGPDDMVNGILPGPAPGVGDDPFGVYYEIPIAIQDRSFNDDGSLFYPTTREFFDGYPGPYIPDSDVSPIWNPEFFGNTMVVNGSTWPYLDVERRRYRIRFLNGCNSRFLVLKLTTSPRMDNASLNAEEGWFWQIGSEGGFLPAAVPLPQLLMAPAERADVIIDFTDFNEGDVVYLVNDGPDAPFGGISLEDLSDYESTGLIMQFRVGATPSNDPSTHPADLILPELPVLEEENHTRMVTLNEEESHFFEGPIAALLGTPDDGPLLWNDSVTENPIMGTTEVWEIANFTEDAHPIHVHLVQFQVLGRGPDGHEDPEPWETGFKDTVIAYPGDLTRIKARFDIPGRYVWHCHIVEHEDNEMMRPYDVVFP